MIKYYGFGLLCLAMAITHCQIESTQEDEVPEQLQSDFSEEQKALIEEIRRTDILEWTPEMQMLGYQQTHEVSPVRFLKPANTPFHLPEADHSIEEISYRFDGEDRSLDHYLNTMEVAGLLVIQEGEIKLEYYAAGHDEEKTWNSFSITKSVLSMLFGAAIADGYIDSIEDEVTTYLPELEGSGYEGVTLENMLRMASGVKWNEDYTDPESDVAKLDHIHETDAFVSYMAGLDRAHEPGTEFNYSTGEVNLAGVLLQEAVGRTLTDYADEKIWQGFGMEHTASWSLIGEDATEHGGCCISATLRDYGRMGMMALEDGQNHQEENLLPDQWMKQSLTPSPANTDYGYLWWLQDGNAFNGSGIFGQYLYVDPDQELIIALQSTWEEATGGKLTEHRAAFIEGIKKAVSK